MSASIVGPCINHKRCKHTLTPGEGPTCRWHIRTGPAGESLTLCNSCKINWDQGKYCPHCTQIYRDRDPDGFDGNQWIGCDVSSCRRWVHIRCEEKSGHEVAKDKHYLCPTCRAREKRGMDVRKRSTRTVPARNGGAANGGASGNSSDDEDEQQHGSTPPMQRTSARRQPRVDLTRLETSSLRKYRRVYKLGDMTAGSREELMPAIIRHFSQQVVEEDETLLSFAYTLRKQVAQRSSPSQAPRGGVQGIKKPGSNKAKTFVKGSK